jgi:Raf kinase inhibitor-like YbhB/YbcL family protein
MNKIKTIIPVVLVIGVAFFVLSNKKNNEKNYGAVMKINLKSESFKENELIPSIYTCDGKNISPELKWDKPSNNIKTFAIIVNDPDAPGGNFIHWIIFNIPDSILNLPKEVTPIKNIPEEVSLGTNSFGHIGYNGPCPPSGTHRYFFNIYGLDTSLKLEAGSEENEILHAMKDHIVAEGELMGKYKRS